MRHRNMSVTALVKELTKLSVVAILSATTALSVGTYKLQSSTDLFVEAVEQIETETTIVGIDAIGEVPSATVAGLTEYIQRFESAGAVNSQGVQSAYQVVYGGIASGDRPTVALTRMTVAEVLAWQDSIDSRYLSEAAGAYQVMEDTLRDLVKAGKVDPEAVFNKATQDAVAKLLMERRGLSKFVAGEISAKDFAANLAREWASFPVVRDQQGAHQKVARGQSYFAGDNLNKAHADVDEFLEVIEGVLAGSADSPKDSTVASVSALGQARPEPMQSEASSNASNSGNVTLGATKPVDGPIKINGKIDLVNYHDWNITTDAEYEFESDSYKFGSSASYEKDDLSFSFSGTHDSDDNSEFDVEVKYHF